MHKPTFPPERCASTVGVRFQRIELPLDPGELPTMIAAGTHRAIVLTKRSAGQPDGLVVFDGRTWSRPKPRCPVVDWMDATTVGDTLYALGQSAHPPGTVELTVGRTTRCSVVPIAGGAYLLRDPLSWVRCGVSGDCGIRTFDTGRLLLRFERSDLLFFPGSNFGWRFQHDPKGLVFWSHGVLHSTPFRSRSDLPHSIRGNRQHAWALAPGVASELFVSLDLSRYVRVPHPFGEDSGLALAPDGAAWLLSPYPGRGFLRICGTVSQMLVAPCRVRDAAWLGDKLWLVGTSGLQKAEKPCVAVGLNSLGTSRQRQVVRDRLRHAHGQ